MEQLVNLTMKSLISDDQLLLNDIENKSKNSNNDARKSKIFKNYLAARAMSENYKITFRLPLNEKLDGTISCTLWTQFNKQHIWGKMYLSNNYICFESRVRNFFFLKLKF